MHDIITDNFGQHALHFQLYQDGTYFLHPFQSDFIWYMALDCFATWLMLEDRWGVGVRNVPLLVFLELSAAFTDIYYGISGCTGPWG